MTKDIIKLLEDNYDDFSKSFKKISNYIIHNQSIISFITINELAKATDTSPATITRFSKEIGFKGYPHFQKLFQVEVKEESTHMKALKSSIIDSQSENILSDIIKTNIELLQHMDTLKLESQIDKTIDIMNNSRKIYILGSRGSYSIAYYFYFLLKEFRSGIELITPGSTDFTDKLIFSEPEDLLITVSFHPYTNFTYQVANYFKKNGNKIITISDKKDSVIGNISDEVIATKYGEKAFTLIPATIIINAILIKLGSQNKEEIISRFDKLKEITDAFNVYKEDN